MNRIRAARQAMGWTQNDLAAKAGVSARTIHAIEKGRPCRQATKRKIATSTSPACARCGGWHRSRRREAPERTRVRGRD
jgi:DNA-binding XRE family transcriptional regulator